MKHIHEWSSSDDVISSSSVRGRDENEGVNTSREYEGDMCLWLFRVIWEAYHMYDT